MDIRSFFNAKPKAKPAGNSLESNNNNKDKDKNSSKLQVKENDTRKKTTPEKKKPTPSKFQKEKKKTPERRKDVKASTKDAEKSNKEDVTVSPLKKDNSKSSTVKKKSSSTKKDRNSSKKKPAIEFDNDIVQIESDNSDFESIKASKTDKAKGKKDTAVSDDDDDDSPIKTKKRGKSKGKAKVTISSEDEDDKEEDSSKKKSKKSKQKKGPIIFDSDSDAEDPIPTSVKKTKKRRRSHFSDSDHEHQATIEDAFGKIKPKSKETKKASEPVAKKPSPDKKQISAVDFFGVASVKRSEVKKPAKRKAVEDDFDDFEIHDDDDFEKTLAQLDEQQPSKKVKVADTPSPEKKQPSLASKLSSKVQETKEKSNNVSTSKGKSPKKRSPVKMETSPVKKIEPSNKKTPEKKQSPDKPEVKRGGSGYRAYVHRAGPQALGSKEIPEGGENCLEGLTFVITGVLESMERDEAKSLVEKYGGKVTGNISKKTSYVIAGRDSGESKMSKARQFGTKEIDEDGMLDLIRTLPGKKSKYEIEAEKQAKKHTPEKKPSVSQKQTPVRQESSQKLQKFANTPERKPQMLSGTPKSAAASPSISRSSSQSTASPQVNLSMESPEHTLLWVDKYKPTSMKQIIGQQGDKSNARKLLSWLRSWHRNRTLGKKPAFNRFNDDGSGHRAALLSGPPGVGKTTTSVIVCEEAKFSYIELNASDTRSKKSLKTEVAEALGNHTLVDFFGSNSEGKSDGHSHCIIMDEVDGMAGNEDRGGMAELIQLIKTTKIPIICMCNDRNHPKVRSLSNHCFDLRFQRPRVEQIKSAMMSIAYKEGIKIPPPALNEMINASNQDVRQVLHNLSMWTATEKNVSFDQVKKDAAAAKKDLKMGPFDVVRKVFVGGEETAHMTIHDKTNLFFQDYSIGPLFVQENYISVTPYAARGNVAKHLECISKAADSLTDGDLTDRFIRSAQNWSLLPLQAMFCSVIPGETMRGSLGGMAQFPQWLGKNSTTNKNDRLLQELKTHMCLKVCTDKRGLNLEYIPTLRRVLTDPLVDEGTDGVRAVVDFMEEYNLLREDFDSIVEVSQWSNMKDPLSQVETKTKSAFTRTYNKEAHLTPYSTVTTAKKGKGKKGGGGGELGEEGMEGEGEGTQDMSSEEEEDPLKDGMIKAKKSTAAKKTTGKGKESKKDSKGATKGKKSSVSKGMRKK